MINKVPKKMNNIEISYSDILWFAVDQNGYVILANSMEGDVPIFVKEDVQKAEYLTQTLLGEPAVKHARKYQIDKSFIYFANTDPFNDKIYSCILVPEEPVHIDSLDIEIKRVLSEQVIEIDARVDQSFMI